MLVKGTVTRAIVRLCAVSFPRRSVTRALRCNPVGGADTAMGNFVACDGRAIRPLEAGVTPIATTCQSLVFPISKRCDSADPGVVCP